MQDLEQQITTPITASFGEPNLVSPVRPRIDKEKTLNLFTHAGFEPIHGTGIVLHPKIVVEVKEDAPHVIFEDYPLGNTRYQDIYALTEQDKRNEEQSNGYSMVFYSKNKERGSHTIERVDIDGNMPSIDKKDAIPLDPEPMELQVQWEYYVPDSGSPQVFRKQVEDRDGNMIEMVAITENGSLKRLLKSNKRIAGLFPEPFEISSVANINSREGDMFDYSGVHIGVKSDRLACTVTSAYGGIILPESHKLARIIRPSEVGINNFPSRNDVNSLPFVVQKNENGEFYTFILQNERVDGGNTMWVPTRQLNTGWDTDYQANEPNNFIVGGRNESDTITLARSFNGIPVAILEAIMQPRRNIADQVVANDYGFLNQTHKLKEELVRDNDYVLSNGTTHQDIAKCLRYAIRHVQKNFGNAFSLFGNKYSIDATLMMGTVDSPFMDGTNGEGASGSRVIKNLTNGKIIDFTPLHLDLIERWGFYEGRGTYYRLEPEDILGVFPFLKEGVKIEDNFFI